MRSLGQFIVPISLVLFTESVFFTDFSVIAADSRGLRTVASIAARTSGAEKTHGAAICDSTGAAGTRETEIEQLINRGSYVRALDELEDLPSSEERTYYTGVCYAHLNKTKLALKEFSWLYYYGKNPKIHQNVIQSIRELQQRQRSHSSVQKTLLTNIDTFQRIALKKDDSATAFFAIVRLYFDKWDVNHDGILTGNEISSALQNPHITAQEAVALAALKTQERFDYRKTSNFEPFTLSELASLQASLAQGNENAKALVAFYRTGIAKVEHQCMRLFAHQLPHISGIKQGHTSDCYFLAVVGSMVTEDPKAVRKMITSNKDGTYTVFFFGVSPVTVEAPTLGEIATYADSGGDGYWLTVLEKSYAIRKEELSTKGTAFVEPLDAVVIHGGHMNPVILALTGHKSRYYNFKKDTDHQDLRQTISNAQTEKRLLATDVPGHCLTLIRYMPTADQVLIWNPWGTSEYYAKADATMRNGFFTLSTDEYLKRFEGICIEK